MVRNLMMIVGLSLAVAAFGCSDDEGGSGGTGGTAGGGGTGGATGACTNAEDTALVCADGFAEQIGACATSALGQGAGTSTCLQEDPGLSTDCADCYGDVTQCVFDNCVGGSLDGPCAPPNAPDSEGCLTCRDESGCDAANAVCTGEPDCGAG